MSIATCSPSAPALAERPHGRARRRRCLDLAVAAALATAGFPAHLLCRLLRRPRRSLRRVGLGGEPILLRRWPRRGGRRLSSLANAGAFALDLLAGRLALVGPRPLAPGQEPTDPVLRTRRREVRPGLISEWWIQRRTNTAYTSEFESDAEYAGRASAAYDLGVLVRALLVAPHRYQQRRGLSLELLDVRIDNLDMEEAVAAIEARVLGGTRTRVAFVNADCLNQACRNAAYQSALNRSDLVLPDGIGVKLACQLRGRPIAQNVNGTDLFPRLCGRLERHRSRVFLLGGRPGVADATARWMQAHFPRLQIVGAQHGYVGESAHKEVVQRIAAAQPDLLLVAMGAPLQELWIQKRFDATGATVALGVGGLFDFYAGRIPRAPRWLREIGAEWVYRLVQEPGRMWRRYLIGNLTFLYRVMRWRES